MLREVPLYINFGLRRRAAGRHDGRRPFLFHAGALVDGRGIGVDVVRVDRALSYSFVRGVPVLVEACVSFDVSVAAAASGASRPRDDATRTPVHTNDVGDVVADVDGPPLLEHGLGHPQMGLGLAVGVPVYAQTLSRPRQRHRRDLQLRKTREKDAESVLFDWLVEASCNHIVRDGHATFSRFFPDVL